MTTAVSSKKNLLAWRAKHQAEQPGCKCLDCQSTVQNVNGVEFMVRPDGTVGWAEDWVVLFDLAHHKKFGLDTKSYGPGTYGHTEVVAGPWQHMHDMGGMLMRFSEASRA